MNYLARELRHRFGIAARGVAVRAAIPWYLQLLLILILVICGFLIGYWRYSSDSTVQLRDQVDRLTEENRQLRTQSIHVESQKQVTQVAQKNLASDMAALQEENVKLKEDIAFYKNILEDSSNVGVVKVHSFKITKSVRPGEYDYRILLIQSGKHDKSVQGSLQMTLSGVQDNKQISLPVNASVGVRSFKINFKYYQPVEGSFIVPANQTATVLQAKLYQAGSLEPKLSESATLPP